MKKISDDGLTDVKTILGILRADVPADEEPLAPRGGLDHLADLIGRGGRRAGGAGRRG